MFKKLHWTYNEISTHITKTLAGLLVLHPFIFPVILNRHPTNIKVLSINAYKKKRKEKDD